MKSCTILCWMSCARNNLVDEGLRLLEEMQNEGVAPSNFTLSLLVKLMNRARRLDRAFSIVEEISKKYRFHPNVHVYTNLIQGCASNQQLARGMSVLEQMIQERIVPEQPHLFNPGAVKHLQRVIRSSR